MGSVQAIPVIGEIATVAEGAGKAIAAGACAAVGQTGAANELMQGAGQAFVNYTEVNAIAANVHMAVAAASGDDKEVQLLRERQEKAWVELAESAPVIGHGIGVVRYMTGDTEGGDRCMMGASRSTLVLAATVATGGVGGAALACGAAAAGSGLVYDGVATGLKSAVMGEFAPVGFVAGVDHAVKTGNANDAFNAAEIPIADAVSGALYGRVRGKAVKRLLERTPLCEIEAQHTEPRPASVVEEYEAHSEVPDSTPQVSLAELLGNNDTAAFVKEFQSPSEAVRGLEWGDKHDFVLLPNGFLRSIKHADAAQAHRILKTNNTVDMRVRHTSLLEPDGSMLAAGEIHIGPTGIWENINCQSGHFQVPLESMKGQIGRTFPSSLLTFESPTFANLLSRATHVAVYTSSLVVALNTQAFNTPLECTQAFSTPLTSNTFILAFHEDTAVKIIAAGSIDFTVAKHAYDAVPQTFAKVLIQRPGNAVLCRDGLNEYVDMCIQQVRQINAVFPQGNWRETSKDFESCFDSETEEFAMRCWCRTLDGGWEVNSARFKPEDTFENQNGKLVKLN